MQACVVLLSKLQSFICTAFYPPSAAATAHAAGNGRTPIGHYVAIRITVDGDLPVNTNTTFTAQVYDSFYTEIPEKTKVRMLVVINV